MHTDTELMNLMSELCHTIAFDRAGRGGPRMPAGNRMGKQNREAVIEHLFSLTNQGNFSKEISSLAESFGLMLVKLETHEVRQAELIQALRKQNKTLEENGKRVTRENRSLKQSLREKYLPARFVGQCSQMEQAMQLALNIGKRPINTLILGASGTGKEVFAKLIHFNSPRAENPFIAINCTAIPETLFESEMFGIKKGVATGVAQRKGIFEQAHTGTLFLDEIGDMSLSNQAKLLRVLEEQEVLPVGGNAPVSIDVKIISATHTDLKQAVQDGRFREDLYYRLNVVELSLPPLKNRGEDILILAEKLLAKNCRELGRPLLSLSSGARQCLLAHDWPGNVRELNNEMERAAALTFSNQVEPEDLSPKLTALSKVPPAPENDRQSPAQNVLDDDTGLNLEALKNRAVQKALEITEGNKTKAAQLLGISREGLRKHLSKTS